ncbi:hypothetical protein VZ170_01360 [Enterobacter hormaechei]|uniref:hypothetical protein n=1 Tax=Enterobacter hormaechei TaxID=158836 RepID=UPI002E29A01C|nr:hypothetical protein [Enterobacter hormaechei]MED5748204.1 hypothetical protein [Enterobacter hormaechei]
MKTFTIGWLNKCRCGNKSHTVKTARGNESALWDDDAVNCNSCGRGGVIQVCEGQARVLWETDEEMAEGKPMSALTKEWLLKTITELEEERDAVPGVVIVDAAMALAAMKLALASLEAEPVAYIRDGFRADGVHFCGGIITAEEHERTKPALSDRYTWKHQPLYTAPPASVSVPDEMDGHGGVCCEVSYADGWNACRAGMLQGADGKPELTVWYGAMPETNGKTNWTAMLHRKGHHPWEGITIDRSEYPGRVRYEADRMRHLIGELADEPDILTYDSDAHSGYVEPVTTAYKLPEGWVAVPVEPTEDMIVNGFESEPDESFSDEKEWEAYEAMSGCQQAAHRATLCWAAMLSAAPKI